MLHLSGHSLEIDIVDRCYLYDVEFHCQHWHWFRLVYYLWPCGALCRGLGAALFYRSPKSKTNKVHNYIQNCTHGNNHDVYYHALVPPSFSKGLRSVPTLSHPWWTNYRGWRIRNGMPESLGFNISRWVDFFNFSLLEFVPEGQTLFNVMVGIWKELCVCLTLSYDLCRLWLLLRVEACKFCHINE